MATVTLTFTDVAADELRAATFHLAAANATRAQLELEPFTDIKELLVDHIENKLLAAWIQQEAEAASHDESVKVLWRDATASQRTAALAALQG